MFYRFYKNVDMSVHTFMKLCKTDKNVSMSAHLFLSFVKQTKLQKCVQTCLCTTYTTDHMNKNTWLVAGSRGTTQGQGRRIRGAAEGQQGGSRWCGIQEGGLQRPQGCVSCVIACSGPRPRIGRQQGTLLPERLEGEGNGSGVLQVK